MQLVSTTEKSFLLEPIVKNSQFGERGTEYNGTPVYHFRTMISEMSLLGSDLMVESNDEMDY